MINISEPDISLDNINAVVKALELNSVSTYGEEVKEFEKKLKVHTGFDTVALNSGTSALEVSIDCIINKLSRSQKFNIGFSDYTFIATPNAILNTANLAVPLICDPDDYLVNIHNLLETLNNQKKLDLIIITLPFGNYSQKVNKLIDICYENEVPLIIDAAASIGLNFKFLKNALSKCFSICLSFNGNKVITSGAGGAILSNNTAFIERVRNLLSLNRIGHYEHNSPGQNKKMAALNAALGLSQLNELKSKINKRRHIFSIYKKFEKNFNKIGLKLFPNNQYEYLSHWLYFLQPLSDDLSLDKLRIQLNKNGYNSPPFWKPVSRQEKYQKFLIFEKDLLKVSYPDLLQIPTSLAYPEKQIENLVKILEDYL